MSPEEKSTYEIMLRVNFDTYQKAKALVESGRYPSMSDLCRTALIEYLQEGEQKVRAKEDMMVSLQEYLESAPGRETLMQAVIKCMRGGKID